MSGYIIKKSNWDEKAAMILMEATKDDPFIRLDDIAVLVQEGVYGLFNVYTAEAEHIASFVIRFDKSPLCEELVIVLAAGQSPAGQSLYELITPYVTQLAAKNGCKYLRGHTTRRGVAKLMENAGYKLDEYICRLEVA